MRSRAHALAAEIENPEIELGADVACRGGLFEELEGLGVVARRAGQTFRIDQGQPMRAFARAGIGRMLDMAQPLAVGAAVEQHGAKPGLGVGIARRERAERCLGGGEIAGMIGGDGCLQRRRHIVRRCLLSARGAGYGEQRRKQRHSCRDHLVLKV